MLKRLFLKNGHLVKGQGSFHTKADLFCFATMQDSHNQVTGRLATSYGQPTTDSHPHLLKPGEVTPGITLEEYSLRRTRLMQAFHQYASHITHQSKHQLVVIPSATKVYMSEKIPYPFRQNSDFLYLTGFLEPDSVLVLKSLSSDRHVAIMFVPRRDPHSELWDGPRTGCEGAPSLLGVDEAYDSDELPNYLLTEFRNAGDSIALWCDLQAIHQPSVEHTLKSLVSASVPKFINSPKPILQQLRLLKSDAEIEIMSRACNITADAFIDVIASTCPGTTEHHLWANMEYGCRKRGADRLAYPPVIAGGDRANIIHYVSNCQMLSNNELVLMDAGCELNGYVSDVTRTWPVHSVYPPFKLELYEALLDVQQILINLCREKLSLDQLYNRMIEILGSKLQEIGVISRSASREQRTILTQQYCPHHVGHYLGMDVHDTPLINRSRLLQTGMVITVEPGVYIGHHDQNAPPQFRSVGIRIEDNVLITDDGFRVLSEKCPKTVSDIQNIRRLKSIQC